MNKTNEKKVLALSAIAAVTLIVTILGATYAYFAAQGGGSSNTDINIETNTTDNLSFQIGEAISIKATQENFAENMDNLSDSTTASAILTANNATNNATRNYYLYFDISNNNFTYSVDENTPELILTVLGPDNQPITTLGDLDYVTVGDVQGFDITTQRGRITIADNYEITTTSTTTQTWTITVTFVNLDADQNANTGKKFDANINIKEKNDITLATNNTDNAFNPSTPAIVSCNNATASYNQKYNRIEVSGVNNVYTNCTLTYENPQSKNYLNNYIIGLSGQTQGTGQVVEENGYRYEGKDPNNYIWFNNELWRIIGVFDESSHGQSGQNLVKIIRAYSIGGLAWDKNAVNDWTQSSIMNLLNGAYLNAEDGTDSGYCYGRSTTMVANCDYREKGINDTYKPMIENVTWYLGGYSSTSATTEAFYGYERGDIVYNGRPTSTTGYIGLMYPSDYGYSVLANSCSRTTGLGSYDTAACGAQSWLYGVGLEWTITPYSSLSNDDFSQLLSQAFTFCLPDDGSIGSTSSSNGAAARPVLYLDSSVYIIDGNGSQADPYIIGI